MTKTKEVKKIDEIIQKYKGQRSGLVGMLQEVQDQYTYLSKETLTYIAEKLDIPLSQTYGLATFYKAFRLRPRGKYLISLCMGTACHVRGAERILEELKRALNIKPGETTQDLQFTLETVNCLGACALGPLMLIDGQYFGRMNAKKVRTILKKYEKK